MRVLFVNPSRAGQGNIPLNIPLLISILKSNSHDVRLMDFSDYACFSDTQSFEDKFFKKADFDSTKIASDRKQFYGIGFDDDIGAELKKTDYNSDFDHIMIDFKPDLIAVSCLSVDFNFICDFILPYKIKHNIPVVFGGIHSILNPDEAINNDCCDFVCIGEGENSIIGLIDYMEGKRPADFVKGIWLKLKDDIVRNSHEILTDLATLPIPDFDCFDPIHHYRPFDGKRYKMLNHELSRGCLFNCTYCVNGVLKDKYKGLGKYHRIKLIDQGISELRSLVGKYSFDFIRFWDEDFTSLPVDFLEKFSKRYIDEIGLPFLIYARVETITEDKIKILKKMGCKTFAMGIESGNAYIRNMVMNRKMSNEVIIEKFNMVKAQGIRVSAYNIIGLPQETRERIFDTIELNRIINPDSFSVTMLEPYRGTPIRAMCEAEGLDPEHETTWNKPQFIPKGMTYEELQGLHRTFPFYIRFPKERFDEIKMAEIADDRYLKLLTELKSNL